ncbi:MAG: T9SS type A sorting domain-containing protein, partial [Bacteroidetes bacterium]|nr:T9SS type A sorting domain-containing protein [Bacteroidota bacterium]
TPQNSSNAGAQATFELYGFSDNLPVASVNIRRVEPNSGLYRLEAELTLDDLFQTEQMSSYSIHFPLSIAGSTGQQNSAFYIPGLDQFWIYNLESQRIFSVSHGLENLQQPFVNPSKDRIALAEIPDFSKQSMTVKGYKFLNDSPEELFEYESTPNRAFLSSDSGELLEIDGTPDRIRFENAELFEIDAPVQASVELRGHRSEIRNDELILYYPSGTQRFPLPTTDSFSRRYTGLISEGDDIYFYLLTDGSINLFSPVDDYSQKRLLTESESIGWPAISDINEDGETEMLFVDHDQNRIVGINREGILLPSFPIPAPQDVTFIGTPLIADLEGDGENDLMISGITPSSSNIYAYNLNGKPKEGFPLLIGGTTNQDTLPLLPAITPHYLASVSPEGRFKVWYFPGMEEIQWASAYGNDTFNKVTGRIEDGTIQEPDFVLLNKEETYNWPNPARNETMIRYQTNEPAEILIRVMTQSGRLLEEIRFQNTSTLPSEYRIDTSKWASGAYYAVVEARANGRTERELVKIAVVR